MSFLIMYSKCCPRKEFLAAQTGAILGMDIALMASEASDETFEFAPFAR
jgi:hypothetical protein